MQLVQIEIICQIAISKKNIYEYTDFVIEAYIIVWSIIGCRCNLILL